MGMIFQAWPESCFFSASSCTSLLSATALCSLTSILLWRLWTFTLLPILYPDDPKELPYWIPVLGHLVSFYKNPDTLQSNARKYFNGSREPFTITLAGTKLYILTNPRDISTAYRNSSTLSFDIFVKLLIRTCGTSKLIVERLYQDPPPSSVRKESLGKAIHKFQVQQSSPGKNLEDVSVVIASYLEKALVLQKMATKEDPKAKDLLYLSLKKCCADLVIGASQMAYFGESLSEINPNLAQTFIEFDSHSWQLLYHFPRLISKGMYAAKDSIIDTLTAYFETPGERTDAAWVTRLLEREMRALGFTTREMGTLMMLQYWGINTNSHKACFWMLSYMLFEPGLIDIIRTETATAFLDDSIDFHYLEKQCPRLQGLWLEVLRITVSSSSVRYITADTSIGGKILRSGNVLINSCRQLHFDESIFGEDISQFNSKRFVNRNLEKGLSWKPFGGGASLCPGRFVARRIACIFVALFIHRFDVQLAFKQAFPAAEQGKPDLGVFVSPDDLFLNIRPRLAG